MREIGPEAEQEFKNAVDVLGEDRVDIDFVCHKVRENISPPHKDVLLKKFGQRINEITDAIEFLELLGHEVRRGGSVVYGYEYQILMDDETIHAMSDLLPDTVIAIANEKLLESLSSY